MYQATTCFKHQYKKSSKHRLTVIRLYVRYYCLTYHETQCVIDLIVLFELGLIFRFVFKYLH